MATPRFDQKFIKPSLMMFFLVLVNQVESTYLFFQKVKRLWVICQTTFLRCDHRRELFFLATSKRFSMSEQNQKLMYWNSVFFIFQYRIKDLIFNILTTSNFLPIQCVAWTLFQKNQCHLKESCQFSELIPKTQSQAARFTKC